MRCFRFFRPFWSKVRQCSARLMILTLSYWTVYIVSGSCFLTESLFECDIAHRRSETVLCALLRSCVTRCTFFIVLCMFRMCERGFHPVIWSHIGIYLCVFTLQNLTVPHDFCFPLSVSVKQSWWHWRVLRAGLMNFYWRKLLEFFLSSTVFPFIFSLSVGWIDWLWSWDWLGVNRSLPAMHCRFLKTIIIIIISLQYCCRLFWRNNSFTQLYFIIMTLSKQYIIICTLNNRILLL